MRKSYGSNTTNYKVAIYWTTLTIFAGSVSSIFLARTLMKNFSGKGLVPDIIADATDFHILVGIGAAVTVIIATFIGFLISTTHDLTGALLGAGGVLIDILFPYLLRNLKIHQCK
ncbi:MAG: inorganic phosphate transporter [Nostocaceae cyanobacterium]|nr:inorganic phosphate transporter [Nostocaceae cyanobacterium]